MSVGPAIGFKGRFFPDQWRPADDEIAFAKRQKFKSIEIAVRYPEDLASNILRSNPTDISNRAHNEGILLSLEIVIKLGENGLAEDGKDASEVLSSYLNAIGELGCTVVHFHPVPRNGINKREYQKIEELLLPQLARAVNIGREHGIVVAFEHNEQGVGLLSSADTCRRFLEAVPDLKFVWDINHTHPEEVSAFHALIKKMVVVHASDTPLPNLNHHLPLGQGSINFEFHCSTLRNRGFQGAIILEIGGLPVSGGTGKDTDEALTKSLRILRKALTL